MWIEKRVSWYIQHVKTADDWVNETLDGCRHALNKIKTRFPSKTLDLQYLRKPQGFYEVIACLPLAAEVDKQT